MINSHNEVKNKIEYLYNKLVEYEGYGDIKIDFRILKKGQKEIIICCGKQYRYVVESGRNPRA